MILTLKSESSYNHCPNSDGFESESSTMRFQNPNRLSFENTDVQKNDIEAIALIELPRLMAPDSSH